MSLKEKIENAQPTTWVTDGMGKEEEKSSVINAKLAAHITIERRDKLGLSRVQFAKEIGVRTFEVAKMESLDHDFTVSELCAISKVIDISSYIKELI